MARIVTMMPVCSVYGSTIHDCPCKDCGRQRWVECEQCDGGGKKIVIDDEIGTRVDLMDCSKCHGHGGKMVPR